MMCSDNVHVHNILLAKNVLYDDIMNTLTTHGFEHHSDNLYNDVIFLGFLLIKILGNASATYK